MTKFFIRLEPKLYNAILYSLVAVAVLNAVVVMQGPETPRVQILTLFIGLAVVLVLVAVKILVWSYLKVWWNWRRWLGLH